MYEGIIGKGESSMENRRENAKTTKEELGTKGKEINRKIGNVN